MSMPMLSLRASSSLIRRGSHINHFNILQRHFVSVGDKVPVNFMKDGKDPIIMKDEEYPPWVKDLVIKGLSKAELMKKADALGYEELEIRELKRLKRLLNLETIKENNSIASAAKS